MGMTIKNLKETIDAITLTNDRRWCTPSGAFLDLLKQLASAGEIDEIPEACRLYFSVFRSARPYVSAALPKILLNYYRPFAPGSDFHKWAERNPDWSDRIRNRACSPGLVAVVEQIKTSRRQFRVTSAGMASRR